MSYRVVWRERLLRSVRLFVFMAREKGADPDAIDRAAAEIERRLGSDPLNEGESRSDRERVLIVHPLTVVYEPFEESGVVMLYDMILYPRFRG